MHHRPLPTVRSSSSLSFNMSKSKTPSPRLTPLLPLVTLAVQNAALSIVMHYSRVSTPPALSYSPASAVLLNELLKGGISFLIALARVPQVAERPWQRMSFWDVVRELPYPWTSPFWWLCGEILSPDCWKLSIPAILYVVQNSLQFVAVSNLPVASFQVTYQMKILTTAAFSGFGAVTAACFTSGLAGVYFEMVLKNSRADLWVRNVQLSLFSLIPALLPVLYSSPAPHSSRGFLLDVFRNFGCWAWATVAIQVFGGLVTAIVIKYSDNILKGFATSLSIILSFLASVALFHFRITPSFIIGATTVLCATWMYNQPPGQEPHIAIVAVNGSGRSTPFPGTPVDSSDSSSPRLNVFGGGSRAESTTDLLAAGGMGATPAGSPWGSARTSPYASPYPSRPVSPIPPPPRSPRLSHSDSGGD
ncbi:nucleotide-sugar transporter-domain-containing protein [Mycena galopus ATCC 62051]|nr:nucleotide-sugar transporter-domain-containing protein [Mycena galopus ATCC 62051]